jgi:hypothetical protein
MIYSNIIDGFLYPYELSNSLLSYKNLCKKVFKHLHVRQVKNHNVGGKKVNKPLICFKNNKYFATTKSIGRASKLTGIPSTTIITYIRKKTMYTNRKGETFIFKLK